MYLDINLFFREEVFYIYEGGSMVIELKNVVKTFSGTTTVHALRGGVDLWIPAGGQIFGIIGQSGAGKSTLVRCINMLERPDQGEVWVNRILLNDLHPRKLREQRKNIGMIFQHFNLLNSRTVFNNIAFPLEIAGLSKGGRSAPRYTAWRIWWD